MLEEALSSVFTLAMTLFQTKQNQYGKITIFYTNVRYVVIVFVQFDSEKEQDLHPSANFTRRVDTKTTNYDVMSSENSITFGFVDGEV